MAELTLAPGPFELTVQLGGALPHRLYGDASSGQFDQAFFLWPTALLEGILVPNQLFLQPGKTMLIVGLANGSGQPARGARVQVSQRSDPPLVTTQRQAEPGNTIGPRDDVWVLFPNTIPGATQINARSREGMPCTRFPGRTKNFDITLKGGEVATVLMICE